jgi:hypothetical protein
VTQGHPGDGKLTIIVTPTKYEIRIRGKVGDPLLASFEGLDASIRPAETVLRGEVADQAALHGLLDRIQTLGLDLIELREVP